LSLHQARHDPARDCQQTCLECRQNRGPGSLNVRTRKQQTLTLEPAGLRLERLLARLQRPRAGIAIAAAEPLLDEPLPIRDITGDRRSELELVPPGTNQDARLGQPVHLPPADREHDGQILGRHDDRERHRKPFHWGSVAQALEARRPCSAISRAWLELLALRSREDDVLVLARVLVGQYGSAAPVVAYPPTRTPCTP